MSSKKFTDWTATIWDYDLLVRIRPYCSYMVFGDEVCPDTGKQHYQTFFQLKTPQTFEWLKEMLPKTHLEVRRGSVEEAMAYCMKDGSFFQEGQVKDHPGQGHRTDIDIFVEDSKVKDRPTMYADHGKEMKRYYHAYDDIQQTFPKPRLHGTPIFWLHGKTGCGKSSYVLQKYPDAYIKSPTDAWWSGYHGQKTVFMDELTATALPVSSLLGIGSPGIIRLQIKGGHVCFEAERVFIATNLAPATVYKDAWQAQGDAICRRVAFYKVERSPTDLRSVLTRQHWSPQDQALVDSYPYERVEFDVLNSVAQFRLE